MADDLSGLASRAQKAVEMVTGIQKLAEEAVIAATKSLQQTHTYHKVLQQVEILLKEHIKDASDMVSSIASKQSLARDVSQHHSLQLSVLDDYHMALAAVQSHKLQGSLMKYVPSDIPEENLTYTLADWANVAELSKVEDEAVGELKELEKLRTWITTTIDKTKQKFAVVSEVCAQALDALIADHRVVDEALKIKIMVDAKRVIHDSVLEIAQHSDRVGKFARMRYESDQLVNLAFQQYSQSLPDKITRIQSEFKRILSVKAEIDRKEKDFQALVAQCQKATTLVSTFGGECQSILREMTTLEEDFLEYKQRPEQDSVFHILKTTAIAWKQFVIAYEEMLFEIARRKTEMERQQRLVATIQKDLNQCYEREQKERKRFEQAYLSSFPQSWPLVALLQEPCPHYTIVASSVPSELPDIESLPTDTKYNDTPLELIGSRNSPSLISSDLPSSSYLLATSEAIDKVLNSSPIESTVYQSTISAATATGPIVSTQPMQASSTLYQSAEPDWKDSTQTFSHQVQHIQPNIATSSDRSK